MSGADFLVVAAESRRRGAVGRGGGSECRRRAGAGGGRAGRRAGGGRRGSHSPASPATLRGVLAQAALLQRQVAAPLTRSARGMPVATADISLRHARCCPTMPRSTTRALPARRRRSTRRHQSCDVFSGVCRVRVRCGCGGRGAGNLARRCASRTAAPSIYVARPAANNAARARPPRRGRRCSTRPTSSAPAIA